jgi:hypothetical protein
MELLLNLTWLLLALPAWWLWRGHHPVRKFGSLHCLLSLGCLLVVLFPVISATDDLRAMRAEMEESPDGRHSIRQAGNEKASAWKWQSPPALVATANILIVSDEHGQIVLPRCVTSTVTPTLQPAGRAPPRSFPG